MLYKQKIIDLKIKNKIVWGLNKIQNQIIKKQYSFNYKDEDIHMSIEKKLFELVGDDAGYIHTARSRNDQVLVDLKIWMINSNEKLIKMLDQTVNNILKIAEKKYLYNNAWIYSFKECAAYFFCTLYFGLC